MSEVYRKRGRVVRYEHGVVVRVTEAGEAIERGPAFECRPLECGSLSYRLESGGFAAALQSAARVGNVERLIITEGEAEHEYGDIRWSETSQRVHVAIAANGVRALVDRADFDLAEAVRIAEVLAKGVREAAMPKPLRLAPNVTAALLPSLIGIIEIEQAPAPYDGKGQPIEQMAVSDDQPPNWYRPSYRVRPQRMWFHLRAKPFGVIDRDAPQAIALVGPRRALLGDGRLVDLRLQEIAAVGEPALWYPHGAGVFGAELML
jgi:hypothetical protein